MKKIYAVFLFAILYTMGFAQSGNMIEVSAHQYLNLFAQNRIVEYADFPDESVAYQNVTMIITMGCMNGDSCSHWDYDLDVYVGDSTGVMDSTLVSIDSTNMNPALWDTTWNVFELVEWHELGRYITPYGNYMNWDQEGFDGAWEHYLPYDVTDFSPMLRGNTPIRVYFHGWQEGFRISVDFEITEGNPTRDVVGVENVYRGGGYTSFAQFDAERTPAKQVSIPEAADEAKLRVVITGHGQSGEFTEIDYTVKASGNVVRVEELWRDDCDELQLSPQGGTWLLSRANWCPGDAVEIHEFELTDYIQGSGANKYVDLDIDFMSYNPPSGASYSLSAQMITYETYRRDYDVLMDEIIAPTMNDNFTRYNPICDKPIVRIKNYGKQELTYCEIAYWVDHTNKYYFDWTGSLEAGETADVELPNMNWANLDVNNLEFFASVDWPNNLPDQFVHNNEKSTLFEIPVVFTTNDIRVRFRANNKPEENEYSIVAADGTIVANETTFNGNSFNISDFNMTDGCYTFEMTDYGDDWEAGDGLNWWLNTQNNIESAGYIEFRNPANNAILQSFTADFGASLRLAFLVNSDLGTLTGNSTSAQSFHPETTPYTSPSGEEFLQVYDTLWISEDQIVKSVDAPTGIRESLEGYFVDVYPNPTNGKVSLLVIAENQQVVPVQIFNLLGEQIDAFSVNTNATISYDLGELSAGFYVFTFELDGKKISKKISLFE
ncbi:MAG: hypothetical protein ACI9O4_000470 [Chitinophagales bacterium]|jgi:hypothetical protein